VHRSGRSAQIASSGGTALGSVRSARIMSAGSALGSFGQAAGSSVPLGFVPPTWRPLAPSPWVCLAKLPGASAGCDATSAGSKPAPKIDACRNTASNCRIANLRRDNARRSYRSSATTRPSAVSSKGIAERSSQRARRTRRTSICAAAMRHAISNCSCPASGPAMARAKAASSCARAGTSPAGRLKPCRHALRAERALPSTVLGPRLARPLMRLAWRLASLIMRCLVCYICASHVYICASHVHFLF
jgi:hypothetical protein